MNLADATKEIESAIKRCGAAYLETAFDEWAIVSGGAKASVKAYFGPRADVFRKELAKDAEPLAAVVSKRQLSVGDIEFTPQGHGSKHDALIQIGARSFLVLNHTQKTIDDLRSSSRWLKVQAILFGLTEKFRVSPLEE